MQRWIASGGVALAVGAAVAVGIWSQRSVNVPPPQAVVFVVLDTVRAQSTSLCGYERPTTPILERLRDEGAAVSCTAYAPAPWTLPSHASFFTGAHVPEHGVDVHGERLPRELETAAEVMAARGYQTVLVTANPVLNRRSGLQRGFEAVYTKAAVGSLRGRRLAPMLDQALDALDPELPVFLVVNVFDAHDPYPAIPNDVGWVDPRREVRLSANSTDPETAWNRFADDRMTDEERASWLAAIRDGYDYGVFLADQNLGVVLDALDERGWGHGSRRLIVTSDHGEYLGEHGLLRHGTYTWEPVTRVPFVVADGTGAPLPDLGGRFAAIRAHELMLHGALADEADTTSSIGFKADASSISLWRGDDKLTWIRGALELFDLAADPAEAQPLPGAQHPLRPELEALLEAELESVAAGGHIDPELVKELAALGYVSEAPAAEDP